VIHRGKSLLIPNDVGAATGAELLGKTSASALLLVPLMHLGKSLGGLLMATRARSIEHSDWRTFAAGVATQITQALALARAYAEREVAERRATQQAALLNALVESAPDLIVQVDIDGTIRFTNGRVRGRAPADLIGLSWFDIGNAAERSAFEEVVATDTPSGYESQMLDGRTYSLRLGPVRHGGKVIAIVVVARDVTERKQAEVQLMLADRMASVGTLAAGVAHEINNPLAAVIANLDMAIHDATELGQRTPLPGDLLEELGDARIAADRVREIVRDLKIFSRSEEDRHGPVDVQHVLESTLRMAHNELRHRARVVKSYLPALPLVDANESRLGQVFLNLIINAAHAIPEGKYDTNEIRVSTALDAEGNVVVSIGDTGGGIPIELRSRLFTPFFTTKPAGIGTGLGLAISHKIVAAYHGSISFESTVGQGTVFRVTLPAAGPADHARTARLPKIIVETVLRRGAILVIDDEESLGLAIKRYLSVQHDVTTVTGARAALDLLEAGHRYDVIFCDLMMPQITGMELHAEMTRRFADQVERMIFVTGGAFTATAREFLDNVRNRRVEKPFDLKVLRGLVNEMIR